MEFNNPPVAKNQMLIRKPAVEVYQAFTDPEIITEFWFDKTSGALEEGKTVNWYWQLFDMSIPVFVKDLQENKRIFIDFPAGQQTTVEWTFDARSEDTTFVTIISKGFDGNGDEIVAKAIDSMGGFSLVIAAAKAYLEHGIHLNIVADHF